VRLSTFNMEAYAERLTPHGWRAQTPPQNNKGGPIGPPENSG